MFIKIKIIKIIEFKILVFKCHKISADTLFGPGDPKAFCSRLCLIVTIIIIESSAKLYFVCIYLLQIVHLFVFFFNLI